MTLFPVTRKTEKHFLSGNRRKTPENTSIVFIPWLDAFVLPTSQIKVCDTHLFHYRKRLPNCPNCIPKIHSFTVFFFFFDSVLCPFQDYFTHRDEPIDRWGETGVPRENHLTHPQAELFLSHMWPVRGSNLHQTQR